MAQWVAYRPPAVRQDAAGRFSLNDFHKAAGEEARHQPSLFLQNQQAKELIAEISNSRNSLSCIQ
ncbi:MAG: KilA-N domain-containing protein [Candidatus Accumulibacter sp.]|nr:KilA-N domain-containing protein [Accumulibacter sp.]